MLTLRKFYVLRSPADGEGAESGGAAVADAEDTNVDRIDWNMSLRKAESASSRRPILSA